MQTMPRPRPPYLLRETTRHGKTVWYVRKSDGPRVRLRAEYGTEDFWREYQAALGRDGKPKASPPQSRACARSLRWLTETYRASSVWAKLALATRRQRENIMRGVIASGGDFPFADIGRAEIEASMAARAATPFAQRNFLRTMRGLFDWAVAAGHVAQSPCKGVVWEARKTKGFPAWTEAEMDAFEARWPVGTRERLAFAILAFTGLRRGDAARLGPKNVRAGIAVVDGRPVVERTIELMAEKTGTELVLPVLPELWAIIEASPVGRDAFIATLDGRRRTKESFGNWFGEAARAAGVAKSAHGLRKAGAARAAENGATDEQLMAIFGWTTREQPTTYTKSAQKRRLARAAISTLRRNTG